MYFSCCSEDIFVLVCEGGAAGQPPVISSIASSPPPQEQPRVSLEPPPQLELPRVSLEPTPSNNMMAAWLYPIVSGETDQASNSAKIPDKVKGEPELMATESKGKLTATVDMSGAKV